VHRWSWSRISKVSSPWTHRRITSINEFTWFFVRPALRATSANSNSERVPNGFQGLRVLEWAFLDFCRAWYSFKDMLSENRFVSGWYSILMSPIEGPRWESLSLMFPSASKLHFNQISSVGIIYTHQENGHQKKYCQWHLQRPSYHLEDRALLINKESTIMLEIHKRQELLTYKSIFLPRLYIRTWKTRPTKCSR
jgi:hypothetical protein